jgi:probable HAF family extracellular repeat protein
MKPSTFARITATTLVAIAAAPAQSLAQDSSTAPEPNSEHVRYTITDLGPVGAPPAQPYFIANSGLIAGAAASSDGALHAVLWLNQLKIDIGNPGLGGPNSIAYGASKIGVVGGAQSSNANDEDFCGFNVYGFPHSDTACLPFILQNGAVTPLPTLGGGNGFANMINDHGVAVGYAETKVKEQGCPVSRFKPVVWKNGGASALPTFRGDPVGVAASINDKGQVVGASGACAAFNPNTGLYMVENHALLWEDGKVIDLGNLGGTGGPAGNHACALNNRGQVVGHSELANDSTFHGFLWTEATKMRDLGTLKGDVASLALGINDSGTVVGASLDANFNSRAVVWKNGHIADLNTLLRNSSALYLLDAASINRGGEVVGLAATSTGELHGFLAIPHSCAPNEAEDDAESGAAAETPRPILSDSARQLLMQHYHVAAH